MLLGLESIVDDAGNLNRKSHVVLDIQHFACTNNKSAMNVWLFFVPLIRKIGLYSIYRQNINYWYQIKIYKTIRKSVRMRQTQDFKHNMANNDFEIIHMR